MFRIKFPTKRIFRIFPILRTDGMAPWRTYLWNDPRTMARNMTVILKNMSRKTTKPFNLTPGPGIGRYESRCVVRSRRWLQNAVVIVPSWPSFNRRAVIVSSGCLLRFSASISATARCQAQQLAPFIRSLMLNVISLESQILTTCHRHNTIKICKVYNVTNWA